MNAIPDYCLKIRSMVDLGSTVKGSMVDMLHNLFWKPIDQRPYLFKECDVPEKQSPMVAVGTLLHEEEGLA